MRWQGLSAYGIFRNFKALKEVKMPVAEEAAHFTDFGMAFQNCDQLVTIDLSGCAGLVSLEKASRGALLWRKWICPLLPIWNRWMMLLSHVRR